MDCKMVIPLIFLLFVPGLMASADELRLVDGLLSSYRSVMREGGVRPVAQHGDTLDVLLNVYPVHVWAMDENNLRLTIKAYINMAWDDYTLQWDPSEFEGINSTRVCSERIWLPDISAYDGVVDSESVLAVVDSAGHVLYVPPATLQLPCAKEGQVYTCSMRLGSWTFSDNLIHLSATSNEATGEGIQLDHMRLNSAWELMDAQGVVDYQVYECCPDPYGSLNLEFTVQPREG